MSASYGELILDEADSGGNLIVRGSATIALSQRVPDAGDDLIFGQAPVTGAFRAGGPPSVRLPFNDTFGPQQDDGTPGSTYGITYNGVPGSPASWSFYFISTNGATQRLSALASTPAAQPGQQYVPLSGGVAIGGAIAPRDITLTDAATVTPTPLLANDFTLLMTSAVGATRAIAAAAPLADCQNIAILLIQPASGGPCAVTWASGADGYDFGSAGAPVLSSAANKADLAAFKSRTVNGTRKWRYLGSQGGYS